MGGTKRSVLIVDDQDNWRDLLEDILEEKFDVVSVKSQTEAREVISQRVSPFHVVISDLRLNDAEIGNEDGLELVKYLRARGTETKTIIVTGYPTVETSKKTFKLEGFDYVEKRPAKDDFNPDEFLKTVQAAAEAAEKDRNHLVFVLMPFAKKYKAFYDSAIKKNIKKLGLDCKRVDDFYGSRSIMADIVKHIEDAVFILADLSGRNPNVFFEVGISHAIGKSVLLLTQKLSDVPPKLQVIRCHQYKSTLAGAQEIANTLKSAVQEIQDEKFSSFFARKEYTQIPCTCIALMPGNKAGERTYKELVKPTLKEVHCKVERANEIFDSNSTLNKIWSRINSAEVVIADLSGRDADVFYLAGLAYGLKKKTIYIARSKTDVPFDLKAGSHLVYTLDPFEKGLLAQEKLAELVQEMLN